MTRKKLRFWKVPVTPLLDEILRRAIELNAHVSISDFIREAVREKLTSMGFMDTEALGKRVKKENYSTHEADPPDERCRKR
jgi:Arc/MetJ-type ribon-helix-helix transcriptional regulator